MIYYQKNLLYLIETSGCKSKNQFAIKIGMSRQALQKTLNTNNPMATTLIAISDIFDISIDDLLRKDLSQQK